MRSYIIAVLVCLSVVCVSAASPAASPLTTNSSPVAPNAPASAGTTQLAVANPVQPMPAAVAGNKTPVAKKGPVENYLPATDFIGQFSGVPLNPTAHLQRSLVEDKKYLASILRAPLDLGDPTDCKHSDIVKDEQELRKIALRINHRRVALRQQQHWIDSATDGLKKIESEIATSTETARNLAEQLDALTAQKTDIVNHVRRAVILKELDSTTENLMRLKDSRLKEEVAAQERHNDRAIRNHKHNKVLKRLHKMRTRQGLALGKLKDPLPYRFAQQGMENAAEEANQQETEQTASTEQEVEQDAEQEVEQSSEQEAEAETEEESA